MTLRDLALNMLDNEQGISEFAFNAIRPRLEKDGQTDILYAVEACEGRFYLTEEKASALRNSNKDTEPQETTPLFSGKPAFYDDIFHSPCCNCKHQNITVEINGEYYQASLAITKEDDILDAGHLVIKPIL